MPEELFSTSIAELPGVAGRRAVLLRRLGIETWFDLLCWFPRDFENWSDLVSVEDLVDGQEQSFVARVAHKPSVNRKGRLSMLRTVLRADRQAIAAIWFNQPWQARRLEVGQWYHFHGKVKRDGKTFSVQNPAFEPIEAAAQDGSDLTAGGTAITGEPAAGQATGAMPAQMTGQDTGQAPANLSSRGFRPVYPLTEGLSQGVIRQLIQTVLPRLLGSLPEPLPAWVRRDNHLCAADYAYSHIHTPAGEEDVAICRRRLGFEELFLLLTGLYLLRRHRRHDAVSLPLQPSADDLVKLDLFERELPFTLTQAQIRVWQEISQDLQSDRPMNRLMQGDVGSGKTVVAALAMLQCALCGGQAVMMAPTSILARQHHQTLSRLLEKSGFTVVLLTGATPGRERKELLAKLEDGQISLLVGTHALIEDQVRFKNLALAITDEQHRFGVRQRIRLSRSDPAETREPHILVMSATPIPRSLALVLYGDLDLSVINELPAGRKPIETYTACEADRARIERLMRRFIDDGRQVYIVCPMIEEQAETDLQSVVAMHDHLSRTVFPEFAVGLLHGGLKQSQKDLVMDEFMSGKTKILVSTTVIEVGVDNPNAALMVVENAGRFGLAQLHQLRGRIGRGGHRSVCILLDDSEEELVRERLRALCHAADGFAVAEKDLELRGPGDFFGTRQHGLPPLRMANLYRDRELLRDVQATLEKLVGQDPDLTQPEHQMVRKTLLARYHEAFDNIGL